MRSVVLVIVVLLCASTASADPGGVDAGGGQESATPISLGVLTGTLGAGDTSDWYALDLPPGTHLGVRGSTTNAHVHLYARTATGGYAGDEWVDSWGMDREFDVGSRVYLEIWGHGDSVEYTLDVRSVLSPDVAVRSIEVIPIPVETDAGPLATGSERLVKVTIENRGPSPAPGRLDVAARTPGDGKVTGIASVGLGLAAGETREYVVEWDVLETGTLGDVDIVATAIVPFDDAPSDNAASTPAYGIVGGTPVGHTVGVDYTQVCVTQVPFSFFCSDVYARPGYVRVAHGDQVLLRIDEVVVEAGTHGAHASVCSPLWLVCQSV